MDNNLWIAVQNYQNADWQTIIQLWKQYNLYIIQVIKSIDRSKPDHYWQNFEGTLVTLQQMIEGYPVHLELHLNESR